MLNIICSILPPTFQITIGFYALVCNTIGKGFLCIHKPYCYNKEGGITESLCMQGSDSTRAAASTSDDQYSSGSSSSSSINAYTTNGTSSQHASTPSTNSTHSLTSAEDPLSASPKVDEEVQTPPPSANDSVAPQRDDDNDSRLSLTDCGQYTSAPRANPLPLQTWSPTPQQSIEAPAGESGAKYSTMPEREEQGQATTPLQDVPKHQRNDKQEAGPSTSEEEDTTAKGKFDSAMLKLANRSDTADNTENYTLGEYLLTKFTSYKNTKREKERASKAKRRQLQK